jgi:cation diffusion facilitator CzcD-associated flavoprotein CzcO
MQAQDTDCILSARILRNVPFVMRFYRLWTALQFDRGFHAFYKDHVGTKAREASAEAVRSYMKSVAVPRYHNILLPHYDFGAKRPVMDHGYLEVTNRDNFSLVKCDGLSAVEGDGRTLVDAVGNRHNIDIVIMANGFKTQDLLTPVNVYGKDGKELRELWRKAGGSQAYMG